VECCVQNLVWVFHWLGLVMIIPHNMFTMYECYVLMWLREIRNRNIFWFVWLIIVWLICKARNDNVFSNERKEHLEVVDEIKKASWRWGLSRLNMLHFLFYEWFWSPCRCIREMNHCFLEVE